MAKRAQSVARDPRRAVVDRYGELKRRIREFQPIRDEYEKLSKEIQSWYDLAPDGQSFIAEGDRYSCQVSARDHETQIKSMSAVFRHFKQSEFLKLATIGLARLRKALPDELHAQFLITAQTGKRRLAPILKATPIDGGKRAA